MTTIPYVKRGTFLVIAVDGTETLIEEIPTLPRIHAAIQADCFDTVTLTKGRDGLPDLIMLVPDRGMIDGLPVNLKATELYRTRAPGSPFGIHGIAALVRDRDFE